ncbi:hypothetical protein ACWC9T_08235 [Kitasatospora sp. NPDC001159]
MPTPAPPTAARRFACASRNFRIQTAATVISGLGNAGAPIATAFAVLGNGGALWICAVLCLLLSAAVLLDPQVRRLARRSPHRSTPDAPVPAPEPAPAP